MEVMIYMSSKNSNYTPFEFLADHLNYYEDILNDELQKATMSIRAFNIEVSMFKKYLYHNRYKANLFQGYVLCDYLRKMNQSDIIASTPEMRRLYIELLSFSLNYIIWIHGGGVCGKDEFNLIQKIYMVLYDAILVETDFILFKSLLDEMINLVDASTEFCPIDDKRFVLAFTFTEDDDFVKKVLDMREMHSANLNWDVVASRLSAFIHFAVMHNHDLADPVIFSTHFVKLMTLLARDADTDGFVFSVFTFTIALNYYEGDYAECEPFLNLDFVHYCLNMVTMDSLLARKTVVVASLIRIVIHLVAFGLDLSEKEYYTLYDAFTSLYYLSEGDKLVEKQMLKFMYSVYYTADDAFPVTPSVVAFLEYVLVKKNRRVQTDIEGCLNVVLSKCVVDSSAIFEYLCQHHNKFTLSSVYNLVMRKFMQYSNQYSLGYDEIIKRYPSCLDRDDMKYIKYNLVYTSLFDKCRLFVVDHVHNFTLTELDEIHHLVNSTELVVR